MKYNQLNTTRKKSTRRVGRGISAGQGKTAGRGTKGQKSRTGSSRRPGFEGGQTPLVVRIPKLRGFKSNRTPAEIVKLAELSNFSKSVVDNHSLAEAGLTTSSYVRVKLVGGSEIDKKLTVRLQAASEKAVKLIEKSGGKFEKVPQVGRPHKGKSQKAEKPA